MTQFEVIPAIDLLDQKVVRLKQGRYDETTFYDHTPEDLIKFFKIQVQNVFILWI